MSESSVGIGIESFILFLKFVGPRSIYFTLNRFLSLGTGILE